MASRLADTVRFYSLLGRLEVRIGGNRILADCHGRMNWPKRGVYFFFEAREGRSESGSAGRIVRIGTHALRRRAKSTLWGRLSQHRGKADIHGGNHRGSIFRLLVGSSLARRENIPLPASWGIAGDLGTAARRLGLDRVEVKNAESDLEARISCYIGSLPFVWLKVNDLPGPESRRGFVERNAITLLSGYSEPAVDPPSPSWLGRFSDRDRVRKSGLWNNNHVDEGYDPAFLDEMEDLIERMV